MNKQRMKLSLNEETKQYIQTYMEENNIGFTGEAIAQICKEQGAISRRLQARSARSYAAA